ncbi:MAG TPA: hypothetical protein DCM41_04500 [Synergistaceae bacterium]|nr:hypothetical protein [Synergistaceae bacterium]
MKRELRRDTWSCGVFALFALDRFSKIFANKGVGFELGPLSYSLTQATQVLASESARSRAFIIIPPVILVFWVFYKCGGMKPKLWTMLLLAGLTALAYDLIMVRGFQYPLFFTTESGVIIFSPATLYLLLGTIAGIFDMAFETIGSKD